MLPGHLKKRVPKSANITKLRSFIDDPSLHTVCESLKCPNIGECFSCNSLTFMVMGNVCTRNCAFCGCDKGRPMPLDPTEPGRVRTAAEKLGLKYVVVTSVTRDDLPDGGAEHFAEVIKTLKDKNGVKVEVLIPDLKGSLPALDRIIAARPDVINHNVETVPRLYPSVRPQADYPRSIGLLRSVKALAPSIYTKSGIMVGLGESDDEVIAVLRDLRAAGCEIVTIGQYLPPSKAHPEVSRYVEPEIFKWYGRVAGK
ncbi:MAG TPA: lipoyl synthase, partial [Candidatus Omnitrophota bacterium]|nr:lipoyl synthase [Candidatus Omnitrophota bacterium]